METEDQQILADYIDVQVKIKVLKVALEQLKPDVVNIMEDYEMKQFENNQGLLTYVSPTIRTSIDGKALKKDLPDVAAKYSKTSVVNAQVKFKAATK